MLDPQFLMHLQLGTLFKKTTVRSSYMLLRKLPLILFSLTEYNYRSFALLTLPGITDFLPKLTFTLTLLLSCATLVKFRIVCLWSCATLVEFANSLETVLFEGHKLI